MATNRVKLFQPDPETSTLVELVELARRAAPYKRGQVTQSLWAAFSGPALPMSPSEVPRSFQRRIGKFIELGIGARERPGRPGTDLEFALEDVVEIGIAIDLQDIGLVQLEIARWLIQHRAVIHTAIEDVDQYLVVRPRTVAVPSMHRGNPFGPEADQLGEPFIARDAPALIDELTGRLNALDRKRIIIEIASLIERLSLALPVALLTRRGRQ